MHSIHKTIALILMAGFVLGLAGCVTTSQDELRSSLYYTHERVSKLHREISPATEQITASVADVGVRMDEADQQMRELQGMAQENQRAMKELDAQLARLSEDYARATGRPAPEVWTPPAPSASSTPPETPGGEETLGPVSPADEPNEATPPPETPSEPDAPAAPESGATIEEAEGAYHAGNYDVAVSQAASFLQANPSSAMADKAHFIQGLSYLKMGRERSDNAALQQAVDAFERVLTGFPRSDYVANALFNQAVAYNDMGQSSRTEALLRRLATEYPDTSAGQKAQAELQKLRMNTE